MTMDVVIRTLAVVGGGALGGMGLGLLAQLSARVLTTKKLPRGAVHIVRLLSGVICGWLMALWLFGGGGPGVGGSGGLGLGSGSSKGNGAQTAKVGKKNVEGQKDNSDGKSTVKEILRIEVLGNAALKKTEVDATRCYRVETKEGPRLLTFAEIKEEAKNRLRRQPPLRRVEIVLYKDSPDERVPLVSRLKAWAHELDNGRMKVDIVQPDANAPMKENPM